VSSCRHVLFIRIEKTEEHTTEEQTVNGVSQELSGSSDDLVQLNDGDSNVIGGFTVLGEAKSRQENKVADRFTDDYLF
jgi:hypothetical protein